MDDALDENHFLFKGRPGFAGDLGVQHIGIQVSAVRPRDGPQVRVDANLVKVAVFAQRSEDSSKVADS